MVNSLVLEMERSGMNLNYRIGARLTYSDRLVMWGRERNKQELIVIQEKRTKVILALHREERSALEMLNFRFLWSLPSTDVRYIVGEKKMNFLGQVYMEI